MPRGKKEKKKRLSKKKTQPSHRHKTETGRTKKAKRGHIKVYQAISPAGWDQAKKS